MSMRRREVLTLIGGAAAAWPVMARAQRSAEAVRRIGVLMGLANDAEGQARAQIFENALRVFGLIAGRNVQVEYVWAGGTSDIRPYVEQLLRIEPDAILSHGTTTTIALRQLTATIPVVFVTVSDPLGSGLVQSLARPSGNVTGFTNFEFAMGGKWIEILKDIDPRLMRAAVLFNPKTAPYGPYFVRSVESAAPSFKMVAVAVPVHDVGEMRSAISAFALQPNGALIVLPDIFTAANRAPIISAAAEHRLPGLFPFAYFVRDGGLISYGVDQLDLFRRSAAYFDRIFKGARPADLPVQQPTKFELVINLKTANALGLTVPPMLLARADEVIE
jgi:putative ABC transport system substrate-binding protein